MLRFVAALPPEKRQPNLLFGAVRLLFGTPDSVAHLSDIVEAYAERIAAVIRARTTQTNEPGRCAALLPALALLRQPLALLEVGASAGLCLLPDRYGYDYGRACLAPREAEWVETPVFPCAVDAATPVPHEPPHIVWRAGLDLNPLALDDPDAVSWLEALVWPGDEARLERLRRAMNVAKKAPPRVVKGDLRTDLAELAADAPPEATLVVFHSAALTYVPPGADRQQFADTVKRLGAVWLSNEGLPVFPEVAAKLRQSGPANRFVLALNGEPLAFTGPHGQCIDWIR